MQPDAEAIRFAAEHDYVGFARQELKHREESQMPPCSQLLRIIIRGKDEKLVEESSLAMSDILRGQTKTSPANYRILGPAPAPLARHKDYFRFHILISSESHSALCGLLRDCRKEINKLPDIEYALDVDPLQIR